MSQLLDELRKGLNGRSPLIYLYTPEEGRALAALRELAPEYAGGADNVHLWDVVNGLPGLPGETRDPAAAIVAATTSEREGFFVFKDISNYMDQPAVVRALRNAYNALQNKAHRAFILLSPDRVIPTILEKEVFVIDVMPPAEDEIHAEVTAIQKFYPGLEISEELFKQVELTLRGMTLNEVSHIMHRVFQRGHIEKSEVLDEIFAEKERIVKKLGVLEFVPPRFSLDMIGGLENLKDWLTHRQRVFTREAVEAGIPVPKGILLMGVSGCGKSLAAKVISTLWQVPLYRLDMNLVFSGMYGMAEAAFSRALKAVEAVAPAVLWIDEIENALNMEGKGTGQHSHMFSTFLTWMQEKPPLVFIAATANRIEALPAEVIRKGRFDQVFFIDLPTEAERKQIIEIHLRRNGVDPKDFDMTYLLVTTDEWNGAEIEQAVIAARVEAYQEDRVFNTRDVSTAASKIVPLSRTMREQIKFIRNWAYGRATLASKQSRMGPRQAT